jgi:hypothetical protein
MGGIGIEVGALTPRAILRRWWPIAQPTKARLAGADHFIEQHGRDYMRRWRFEAHMT